MKITNQKRKLGQAIIKFLFIIVCSLSIIVLSSVPALAWGPGMHLFMGQFILNNLQALKEPTAHILGSYPYYYLYGCLSADILIGKGKKLTPTHCHSWEAGFNLLRSVKHSYLKSYAFGYLSHLASDVIAHNYYVPNILQLGNGKGKISHVYIEMQADRKTEFNQHELKRIMQSSLKEADFILLKILQKSKLTFSFKKKIFQGGMAISKYTTYNSSLDLLEKTFSNYGCEDYLEDMRMLSKKAIIDCLNNQDNSLVTTYDPMGFKNLDLIKKNTKRKMNKVNSQEAALFFLPSIALLSL